MTDISKLLDVVETLTIAHMQVEEEIAQQFPDITPYTVKDTSGRYILLDSLVALANAHTAVAMATAIKGR